MFLLGNVSLAAPAAYNALSVGEPCTVTVQCKGFKFPNGLYCAGQKGSKTCQKKQSKKQAQQAPQKKSQGPSAAYNSLSVGEACRTTVQCKGFKFPTGLYCAGKEGNKTCQKKGAVPVKAAKNKKQVISAAFNSLTVGESCRTSVQCKGFKYSNGLYCAGTKGSKTCQKKKNSIKKEVSSGAKWVAKWHCSLSGKTVKKKFCKGLAKPSLQK